MIILMTTTILTTTSMVLMVKGEGGTIDCSYFNGDAEFVLKQFLKFLQVPSLCDG